MLFKEYAKNESLLDGIQLNNIFIDDLADKETKKNGAISLTSIFNSDSFVSAFFNAETIETIDDYNFLINNYGNWKIKDIKEKILLNNSIGCNVLRLIKPENVINIGISSVDVVIFSTDLINKRMMAIFYNDGFNEFVNQTYTVLNINFNADNKDFYASYSRNLNNSSIILEVYLLNSNRAYTTNLNNFDLTDKSKIANSLYNALNKSDIFQVRDATIKNIEYDYTSYVNK